MVPNRRRAVIHRDRRRRRNRQIRARPRKHRQPGRRRSRSLGRAAGRDRMLRRDPARADGPAGRRVRRRDHQVDRRLDSERRAHGADLPGESPGRCRPGPRLRQPHRGPGYKSKTNTTPEKFEYIPAKNIDKKITEAESNTGPLLDEAELKTAGATLKKKATTETTQPGNTPRRRRSASSSTTTVIAKIPPNSKIYGRR